MIGLYAKLSKVGADLMHKYEGYRTRPYLCPAHIWTIGYGHVLYQEQIRLPMFRPEVSIRSSRRTIVSGQSRKLTNYSRRMSRLLNVVFFDLFPAVLAVKAALTLWSVFPSILG